MAEEKYVNHPIDTSKAAVYDGEWDGDKAKHDLIKEEKYSTLAPKVCLRLEEGWKDREVSKLGYPVMCLHGGKWVYSSKGLASALGYAKQHGDNDIVSKVESIRKKLGLDSDRKEESAEMNEIENQTSMAENENVQEKDAYMSEDTKIEDTCLECNKPMSECECAKCSEDENENKGEKPEDEKEENKEAKMSEDEMMARISQLEADIEARDNIIMEKDAELEELRQFKQTRLEQDRAMTVASVMQTVAEFMDKDEYNKYQDEGMKCEFNAIDAWTNKVKASVVDKALKKNKNNTEFSRIAAPVEAKENKPKNVWERIKNN